MRPLPPALREIAEGGTVVKLAPVPDSSCPEAAFLGLDPQEYPIAQGPLTVACLGHHPPPRSVHFHLTLACVDKEGKMVEVGEKPTEDELRKVFEAIEQLQTKTLTPLVGEALDHALVWENGSLEMETDPFASACGHDVFKSMPQGGGEQMLRQFIDDSINLLSSLEINHKRREEGMSLLNCLWPWGQGIRPDLPNLALRRGDIVHVESDSMRLTGLVNLVGYRHGERSLFKKGMATDFVRLASMARRNTLSLVVVNSVREMQVNGRVDEIAWTLERLSSDLIEPLLATAQPEPYELRLALPGGHCSVDLMPKRASSIGLGLAFSSVQKNSNGVPFDERCLEDPRVPTLGAHKFVLTGLMGTD